MRSYWRTITIGLVAMGFVVGATGCQWIASVDRDKLSEEEDSGAGGGAGTAGTGGVAGQGGVGKGGTGGGAGGDRPDGGECTVAEDCPETGNECVKRVCEDGVCGTKNVEAGYRVEDQETGDCKVKQCDGNGAVETVNDDTDVFDDGNDCTIDSCEDGEPKHAPTAKDTACGEGGKLKCDGDGQCVGCTTASECSGEDTFCKERACDEGVCGFTTKPSGEALPKADQVEGDCKEKQCDGDGNVVDEFDDSDIVDDGNECTDDVCDPATELPTRPPKAINTRCEGDTKYCDGAGQCVMCTDATQCPNLPTIIFCGGEPACVSGGCTVINFTPDGTPLPADEQTEGPCKEVQCDGAGSTKTVNKPELTSCEGSKYCNKEGTCVECVKSEHCTTSPYLVCSSAGACVSHCTDGKKNFDETDVDCGGNACAECGEGKECTINDDCAEGLLCKESTTPGDPKTCQAGLKALSVTPEDGDDSVPVGSDFRVVFSSKVKAGTISARSTVGSCEGSVQLKNDLSVCLPLSCWIDDPDANGDGTTLVCQLPMMMSYGSMYEFFMPNSEASALEGTNGKKMDFPVSVYIETQGSALRCGKPAVRISQIYVAGGKTDSAFNKNYIELHNVSNVDVDLSGYSLQYSPDDSGGWKLGELSGTIPPGRYFLVESPASGNVGAVLPTPDDSVSFNMEPTRGVVALVNSNVQLPDGVCASSNTSIVDVVSWNGIDCIEGNKIKADVKPDEAYLRRDKGCYDGNLNNSDFAVDVAAPRYIHTTPQMCPCGVNESDPKLAEEADWCNIQHPLVVTGSLPVDVFGRVYENGLTPITGSVPANLVAQLGWGPVGVNPSTQCGFEYIVAQFNRDYDNNAEFKAALPATVSTGQYRYVYRFSVDEGKHWTYCDTDGAGSNSGLGFSVDKLGELIVAP